METQYVPVPSWCDAPPPSGRGNLMENIAGGNGLSFGAGNLYEHFLQMSHTIGEEELNNRLKYILFDLMRDSKVAQAMLRSGKKHGPHVAFATCMSYSAEWIRKRRNEIYLHQNKHGLLPEAPPAIPDTPPALPPHTPDANKVAQNIEQRASSSDEQIPGSNIQYHSAVLQAPALKKTGS